jgi:hypothetical protein
MMRQPDIDVPSLKRDEAALGAGFPISYIEAMKTALEPARMTKPQSVATKFRRDRVMRRLTAIGFAVLAGLVLAASPSAAAGSGVEWNKAGRDSFTDLPGVKPQDPQLFGDGYRCETMMVAPRRINARDIRDSLPQTVYRCEKDGVIYQGTQPPSSGRGWYPGVNPRVLE